MSPAVRSPIRTTMLPRSFGRYVLFDFIGNGGMAEIYLARRVGPGQSRPGGGFARRARSHGSFPGP